MIRNLYELKVNTLSFAIILIVVFVLSQSVLGVTQDDTLSLEGFWKQVGYGRVVEIKKGKVKIYDVSKVSCILVNEDKTGNENIKEITKDRVVMKEGIGEMVFGRIKSLPKLCSQNTEKEKDPLFNFDSLWHTFNENYAYFNTRNIDWDGYYKKYRSRLSPKSSEAELYEVIKEMLDSIGDGHINFKAPKNVRKTYEEKQKKSGKKEMSDMERILTSQKLTDQIATKYAKNIKTYNSGVLRWGVIEGDIAYLQINFMFLMSKQNIPENASFLEFVQKYMQIVEESSEQEKAEKKGAADAMKMILKDTANAKAFIIDIRFNPGGTDSVSLAFLSHFTDSRKKAFTKKARLGNGFTRLHEISIDPAKPSFKGNVYLLTSHQSGSAAEIMSISTNVFPNITRIGSNTNGIFSDVLGKKLPNGWEYSLSNEVYQDLNGVDYENKGIPPHHEIKYPKDPKAFFTQISSEIEKGDTAIDAAIKMIRGKMTSKQNKKAGKTESSQSQIGKIGGNWRLVADAQGQEVSITMKLTQDGSNFSGTISTPYGNGSVVDGKIVGEEFTAKVRLAALGLILDMEGTFDGKTMTGTMDGEGAPNVTFVATKTN